MDLNFPSIVSRLIVWSHRVDKRLYLIYKTGGRYKTMFVELQELETEPGQGAGDK